MSNEHAMRFPLVGSAMLLSLFLLFKFLSKDLVNAVLTCYFFVLGIAALSYVLSVWIILLCLIYSITSSWIVVFLWVYWMSSLSLCLCSATLLPAIRRFLPKKWNDDLIIWHFPYFRCRPLLSYLFWNANWSFRILGRTDLILIILFRLFFSFGDWVHKVSDCCRNSWNHLLCLVC